MPSPFFANFTLRAEVERIFENWRYRETISSLVL